MPLLSVDNVTVRFGGVVALDEVSVAIDQGQIAGLIGPNGAGKTTCFNVITRLYTPQSGHVMFEDVDLLRRPAHKIARAGIARTFQNVVLFEGISVLDNVLVGLHARTWYFHERQARREAQEALAYLGLSDLAGRPAGGLPYGTLKRIELARALAAKPRLLLLDEPAGGLNHSPASSGACATTSTSPSCSSSIT
jgi:branched-chain amino acid transport system ATP-binding protein